MNEIFKNKKALKTLKCGLKRFYFIVEAKSFKRGYNRTITVIGLRKDGSPVRLGMAHRHTASYKGDSACAAEIVAECCGYKMKRGAYDLIRKDVTIYEI